ncbi:hypothetical protein CEXT_407241 [Caerostris extrusa]|uniref:Uncharacterized protein n=1 Tax=Caerostris extrusa TaxID=172846 RepID=A0AAV4NJG6_CAEEX|nr:hypothetical protein CEXT_407241 [Caerostris extrusa]
MSPHLLVPRGWIPGQGGCHVISSFNHLPTASSHGTAHEKREKIRVTFIFFTLLLQRWIYLVWAANKLWCSTERDVTRVAFLMEALPFHRNKFPTKLLPGNNKKKKPPIKFPLPPHPHPPTTHKATLSPGATMLCGRDIPDNKAIREMKYASTFISSPWLDSGGVVT